MRRPSRRCGLDGGLHRGSIAWCPGPNPTRKPREPWVCSPLSGQTYGADVHSSLWHMGVDPPGVTAAGLGIQESHENEVLKKEGACEGTESEK